MMKNPWKNGRIKTLFFKQVKEKYPEKEIECWYQDETRYGQKGRTIYMWAKKGSRPNVSKQNGFLSQWICGAINPDTGGKFALILPKLNKETMGLFMKEFEATIPENKHYILILDNAKWHGMQDIDGEKITLRFLPPYAPQLNCIERLWLYMKNLFLSHISFEDNQDLLEKGQKAWRALSRKEIMSVCRNSNFRL